MRIVGSTLVSLLLAACSMSHDGRSPRDGGGGEDGGTPATCTPLFEACETAGECCDGYCPLDTYGPVVCTARAPDGAFCLADDECATRRCVASVCGGSAATCVSPGAGCSFFPAPGGECCAGARCGYDASGSTVCLLPADDGAACSEGADCASGTCIGGRCGVPAGACVVEGDVCSEETGACCGGLSCVFELSYGPTSGYCRRPLADGEACGDTAASCASGRCIDGMCRRADCVSEDFACDEPADCCTGFCDTSTYGPWFCRPRQPRGAYCQDHTWCASYVCNAGFSCE